LTKKVGNKILWEGTGGPKKVGPDFCLFEAELFFGFLGIVRHHGQSRSCSNRRNTLIKKINNFSVLLSTNRPRKHTFWFTENGKIIHFEKLGPTFSKGGVEPFLNLAGPNFRPKKLGTKLSWDGEWGPKKVGRFFPDFLLSSDATGYSDKKNKQFFRASLDEQTTKTYFSGFWKTGKIIHFEKIGSNFSRWGVEPFLNLTGPNF
jgi:hypothetical protein